MSDERCAWANRSEEERAYHDQEWGVPSFDARHLFEMLILEGAQAGLSWTTVLRKRENYRQAFDQFDFERVASFDNRRMELLLNDTGIIRNRLKIAAAIQNARGFLALEANEGAVPFLWQFVDGRPVQNHWRRMEQIPASTPASEAMSRELKRRGFRFVGATICYAFMQAVGMVNDHLVSCPRHGEINRDIAHPPR